MRFTISTTAVAAVIPLAAAAPSSSSPSGTLAQPLAAAAAVPPAQFTPNPRIGPGGTKYRDSARFRVYGATNDAVADRTMSYLEAAYSCFVDDLGWRSPGLSFRQVASNNGVETGPWYKLNVYQVATLPGAAANTPTDMAAGLAWLNVQRDYMDSRDVVVHEFGHALTYAAFWWIDQVRTGAWWETVANFVADTFLTNGACAAARARYGQSEGNTLIDVRKVLGDAHQVIVDGTEKTGNYYQAWPFLTYLFNNPDETKGLGRGVFPGLWTAYNKGSNETPLHVLERLLSAAGGPKVQSVVARYWARMAFVDIGHEKARAKWEGDRRNINYANVDGLGGGRWRVKTARRPRYMGASIVPLKGTGGNLSVTVTVAGGGQFAAALALRAGDGRVRYVELAGGSGQTTVAGGEEVILVVANTPALVLFDPFKLTSQENAGLDWTVQISGGSA